MSVYIYIVIEDLLFLFSELLRTLVAARLTQSIAMGAFSLSKDPTNEYLKLHAQPARKTLLSFWQISPEEVNTVFLAAVNGNNSDGTNVL